jgi:hypothetical protein
VPLKVGALLAALTTIENGASEAEALPSLTLMRMSMYSPAALEPGVPDRRPVEELKEAQPGRLATLKVRVLPSPSDALGVNE